MISASDPSDRALLERYTKTKDNDAFAQLFDRYRGLVLCACLRETHDPELAEDCCSAVFLLVADRADRLTRITHLASWLFTTARLTARNAKRAEERRVKAHRNYLQHIDSTEPATDIAIDEALAKLRESDREAILLRYGLGLSYAEIGSKLGIGEAGARMKTTRGLNRVRARLLSAGCQVETGLIEASLSGLGSRGWTLPNPSAHPTMAAKLLAETTKRSLQIKMLQAAGAGVLGLILVGAGAPAVTYFHQSEAKAPATFSNKYPFAETIAKPVPTLKMDALQNDPAKVAATFLDAFVNPKPDVWLPLVLGSNVDRNFYWSMGHLAYDETHQTIKLLTIKIGSQHTEAEFNVTTPGQPDQKMGVYLRKQNGKWWVVSNRDFSAAIAGGKLTGTATAADVFVWFAANPQQWAKLRKTPNKIEGECKESLGLFLAGC